MPTPIQAEAQTAGYDPAAKSFHWVSVALVGAQFTITTVAHARMAHADRADPGHYLACRQVPVADHAAQASRGLEIDMLGEKLGHLGLDRLGQ
jgi:hypothetical protein